LRLASPISDSAESEMTLLMSIIWPIWLNFANHSGLGGAVHTARRSNVSSICVLPLICPDVAVFSTVCAVRIA
jgi:hypothetical protein